ncbi:MAG: hypothetical protein ACKVYV_15785 [Limisphaerales bacterium]
MNALRARLALLMRTLLMLIGLALGAYVTTMARTSGFGLSFQAFCGLMAGTLIFTAPFVVLSLLGAGWKHLTTAVLMACLTVLVFAEAFGRAQEILIVQKHGAAPPAQLIETRWWPFRHHHISYDRRWGWSGSD